MGLQKAVFDLPEAILSLLKPEKSDTEKNLSNEIEGTSKFVCYRQISLQTI